GKRLRNERVALDPLSIRRPKAPYFSLFYRVCLGGVQRIRRRHRVIRIDRTRAYCGMRILCTNDDGIHAPGLKVIEEIARALSDDVWVVAPELDQSGVSHSLSLNDPLRLREVGPRHFAVRGTPTDCV